MNNIFANFKKNLLLKFKINNPDSIFLIYLSKICKESVLLYPMLLSIYPLLYFYYTNISEAEFKQVIPLLVLILFSTFILLLTAKCIIKDNNKIILINVLILVFFFSFGHLNNILDQIMLPVSIRYRTLFSAYVAIFLLPCFFIFKSKRKFNLKVKILNTFSLILLVVVLVRIITYNTKTICRHLNTDFIYETPKTKLKAIEKKKEYYPDIYYVVLDAYANSRILNEYFNFDNSDFEQSLEEKGFFVAKNSRANYLTTFLSLASTLNMTYINSLKQNIGIKSKDRKIPNRMIQNNIVNDYLANKGYKIIDIKSGWGATNGLSNTDYSYSLVSSSDFLTSFIQTTILYPIVDKILIEDYAANIEYAFDKIPKITNSKKPKFVFAHIICPHPPFLFNENGERILSELNLNNTWVMSEKKYYIGQLKFINKKTLVLVDQIIKSSKNSIIILQSDHGSSFSAQNWKNTNKKLILERGKILNAILINNQGKKTLYDSISSVNTFRIVFNNVFKANFKILSDSTYFSDYETPYNFINVTKIINDH
jgi:hypothetical protein